MTEETPLQDRLRDHARSFDDLLSLIPAKAYFGTGEDASEQWKKRKQTKAEKKAARIENLDPENELNKSVKEVLDDRARSKRKLEQTQHEDDPHGKRGRAEKEQPGQEHQQEKKRAKKQKLSDEPELLPDQQLPSMKSKEASNPQRRRKGENATSQERPDGPHQAEPSNPLPAAEPALDIVEATPSGGSPEEVPADALPAIEDERLGSHGFPGLDPEEEAPGTASPSLDSTPVSSPGSPTFDTKQLSVGSASTTASILSVDPAAEKPKQLKIPADTSALRARIAAKIEALRAARKADTKPIRTRQELIEARREKQAERKAHKKELRRQAKLEEDRIREEALASARNSPGSVLSPLVGLAADGDDGASANHFAFGRVAFDDGAQMSHDLSHVKDVKKKRGPAANDHKAHLKILENSKTRLAGMDEEKRKDLLEKDTWLAARKRAEGTKVYDEGLLKKAVKRKEKAKKKSEKEWGDRKSAVEKSVKEQQRKREDNLRKRREGKTTKKGKKGDAKSKKRRAGFEGRSALPLSK